MKNKKTMIRFFTIADYEEEEAWLRVQHQNGWRLTKTVLPCFYLFQRCTPEDVVYRLDFKPNTEGGDYFQLFQDYGWECFNRSMGWLYFRKPMAESGTEQDSEIFSDDLSRVNLINSIIKVRLIPLVIIFICCLLPNFINSIIIKDPLANILLVIFTVLLVLYLYLFIHCGIKLRKLKRKYSKS